MNMAGLFIIGNEHLSSMKISKPLHLATRPKSSRKPRERGRSAVILSSTPLLDLENVSFPQILNSDQRSFPVRHSLPNEGQLCNGSGEERASAFPNFRLLQRLAASAKSRLSKENQNVDPKDLEIDGGKDGIHFDHDRVVSETSMYSPSPPLRSNGEIHSDGLSHDNLQRKKKKPKSRKKRRSLRNWNKNLVSPVLKTPDKTLSQNTPSPSKPEAPKSLQSKDSAQSDTVPTFSNKFKKRRELFFNNSKNSKKNVSQTSSSGIQFSLTSYPGTLEASKADTNLAAEEAVELGECLHVKHEIQVSALHSIYRATIKRNKPTKVFQSDKQSGSLKQCGKIVPCAPPSSPMPELLQKYEYVPSLSDLKSQQNVKNKLFALEKEARRKLNQQKEELKKKEKQLQQSHITFLRVRQRQEIYALNKIMTKLEYHNFKLFCEKMG